MQNIPSVHYRLRRATAITKAAATAVDGHIASIRSPGHVSTGMSPGEIMSVMAQAGGHDTSPRGVMKQLREARKKVDATAKEADDLIDEARNAGDALLHVAEFLRGKRGSVDGVVLPGHVLRAAKAVKAASASGVPGVPALALADELERSATAGLLLLSQTSEQMKTIARTQSAGRVAAASQSEKLLLRRSKDTAVDPADRAVFAILGKAAGTRTRRLKAEHAGTHFTKKQLTGIGRVIAEEEGVTV
jgi:hypothetical protein